MELIPASWTAAFPLNRTYDFLYDFLDFENEKRLIVYGLIIIVMMIFRPQGFLTPDSVRRFQFLQRRFSSA